MDRLYCPKCQKHFYFDLWLEGITAVKGQKLPIACPFCYHEYTIYDPEPEEDNIPEPESSTLQ